MAKPNTVKFHQTPGKRGHFGAQVQIKGLKQAQRLMGRLDDDFKRRFKEIHKGAADIVADEARKLVPVGRPQRKSRSYRTYTSAALKNSIRTSGTNKGGIVRVGKKKDSLRRAYPFWRRRRQSRQTRPTDGHQTKPICVQSGRHQV